jgi:hypothetical protein
MYFILCIMNKKEAAEFLKVSEKTIERYKSAGKIAARMIRVTGDDGKARQVLDFKEADLQKLKNELSGEKVFPIVTNGHAQTKTQTDTDGQTQTEIFQSDNADILTQGQTQTVRLLQAIFEHSEFSPKNKAHISNLMQKPILTEREAAEISGLTLAFIQRARKNNLLRAIKDVSWKIKRADLDEFIKNL